ncbi:MAG: DUF559 domain-containing protein [Armatimonadetes bacterium]|nr:DUF559 domain-containing protein [Armatimonadota bacterium]
MRMPGYFYARSPEFRATPESSRLLVGLVPSGRDLGIAREQRWYRVPVRSAPSPMAFGWLALYQVRAFDGPGYAIGHFARIVGTAKVSRRELLPEEPDHPRADEAYYKLSIDELRPLPNPVISRRRRFIVFICTTLDRLHQAREINDLFCESPLEERMWEQLRDERIEAERQWYLRVSESTYCLDFAVFCASGKVDVECDGDRWHADRQRIPEDNARDNALATDGWAVLRFNTARITGDLPSCVMQVRDAASRYGGIVTAEGEHWWPATGTGPGKQLSLFNGSVRAAEAEGDTRPEE